MTLAETMQRIVPIDRKALEQARERWDAIAKPLGSLGKLEEAVCRIAGITRTPAIHCKKRALLVLCADNGIVEEGISQSGPEVTAAVAENFLAGKTCTSLMAEVGGVDVFPVDIGMIADTAVPHGEKVARGTKNFLREPAMSRTQAVTAVETGIRLAQDCVGAGYQILATGEMGIGNTATSSAVTAVLLHLPPEEVTGKGSGLSEAGLIHKIAVIREGLARRNPNPEDPLDVLAQVGGLDLAGLTGIFLGAAALRVPVMVDGFISAAAALLAQRLCPCAGEYMLASHLPAEPAGPILMEALGLDPWLDCRLRLGEGSGAVAAFPLLDMAVKVYREMPTFGELGLPAYVPL